MSDPLPVRFSRRAELAVREAAIWWKANRDKAPDAFAREVERAVSLIASYPRAGAPAASLRYAGLRRLYLKRIRYYLYYLLTEDRSAIEVLGFWHASRGAKPEIREPRVAFA